MHVSLVISELCLESSAREYQKQCSAPCPAGSGRHMPKLLAVLPAGTATAPDLAADAISAGSI